MKKFNKILALFAFVITGTQAFQAYAFRPSSIFGLLPTKSKSSNKANNFIKNGGIKLNNRNTNSSFLSKPLFILTAIAIPTAIILYLFRNNIKNFFKQSKNQTPENPTNPTSQTNQTNTTKQNYTNQTNNQKSQTSNSKTPSNKQTNSNTTENNYPENLDRCCTYFDIEKLNATIENSQKQGLKIDLNKKFDWSSFNTPIKEAISALNVQNFTNCNEFIKILIENGTKVTKDAVPGILVSLCSKRVDLLIKQLPKEKDENKKIIQDFINEILKVAKTLIDAGADVNSPNETGWTPICAACEGNNFELVKLLVTNGANVNSPDAPLVQILNKTEITKYKEIIKYLIEHGAKKNQKVSDNVNRILRLGLSIKNATEKHYEKLKELSNDLEKASKMLNKKFDEEIKRIYDSDKEEYELLSETLKLVQEPKSLLLSDKLNGKELFEKNKYTDCSIKLLSESNKISV